MRGEFDFIVVGGGIVGLATSRALCLSRPHASVALIEKESSCGTHQTGHNSGVIHSGLYYKPGSLKAQLCVRGRKLLIEYAKTNKVAHEICGKVVVATNPSEELRLKALFERGQLNGLNQLEWLSPDQLKETEPFVRGLAALRVPEEGIIDYGELCQKLEQELRQRGVEVFKDTQALGAEQDGEWIRIRSSAGALRGRRLIACAGLQSDRFARSSGCQVTAKIVPFRGEYYKLSESAQSKIRHLVYPVPDPSFPFLGVHFTRMIQGGVECGPNAVLAYDREGYDPFSFSLRDTLETLSYPGFWRIAAKHWKTGAQEVYRSLSKRAFLRALQKLVPSLTLEEIEFFGSGIRAQALSTNGQLLDDFVIETQGAQTHVLNAPSPAATSALAIGQEIAARALGT